MIIFKKMKNKDVANFNGYRTCTEGFCFNNRYKILEKKKVNVKIVNNS